MTYTGHRYTQQTLAILDTLDTDVDHLNEEELAIRFGYEDEYHKGQLTAWMRFKPKAWLIFNEPYSSLGAKLVAIISVLFICLSIFSFCLKTHPSM